MLKCMLGVLGYARIGTQVDVCALGVCIDVRGGDGGLGCEYQHMCVDIGVRARMSFGGLQICWCGCVVLGSVYLCVDTCQQRMCVDVYNGVRCMCSVAVCVGRCIGVCEQRCVCWDAGICVSLPVSVWVLGCALCG